MLLALEFRNEWPDRRLLSNDDLEFIRVAVDTALDAASREGHVGDIYDLSPTVWTIWLIQHTHATRNGGWTAESESLQTAWSFENLYGWLAIQHSRMASKHLRDPTTNRIIKRYTLPPINKLHMH